MENLLTDIQVVLGDIQTGRYVFLTLIGLSVMALFFGMASVVSGVSDPVRRRMNQLADIGSKSPPVGVDLLKALRPVQAYVLPKDNWERNKVQARLVQAGYRAESALWTFYGMKTVLAVSMPGAVLIACAAFASDMTMQKWMLAVTGGAWAGMMLPNFMLGKMVEKRQRLIRNAIPDALDLLVVCIEAGLGLRAAIQRVSDDLYISHPEFANELELVNAEMRAGITPDKALQGLGSRVNLKELEGLISTLVDSVRFGTSIADTLRAFAEDFRDRRIQAAEEQAAKIGTKMVFPLILFLLPSFFIVAVGPAVLKLIDSFSNF